MGRRPYTVNPRVGATPPRLLPQKHVSRPIHLSGERVRAAHVRVELRHELAMRLPDFHLRGAGLEAKDRVSLLRGHRTATGGMGSLATGRARGPGCSAPIRHEAVEVALQQVHGGWVLGAHLAPEGEEAREVELLQATTLKRPLADRTRH